MYTILEDSLLDLSDRRARRRHGHTCKAQLVKRFTRSGHTQQNLAVQIVEFLLNKLGAPRTVRAIPTSPAQQAGEFGKNRFTDDSDVPRGVSHTCALASARAAGAMETGGGGRGGGGASAAGAPLWSASSSPRKAAFSCWSLWMRRCARSSCTSI